MVKSNKLFYRNQNLRSIVIYYYAYSIALTEIRYSNPFTPYGSTSRL